MFSPAKNVKVNKLYIEREKREDEKYYPEFLSPVSPQHIYICCKECGMAADFLQPIVLFSDLRSKTFNENIKKLSQLNNYYQTPPKQLTFLYYYLLY